MAGIAGFGALLHTDVERVELGTHHGRVLRGRVEHRTLRLAAGRGWQASVLLGRRHAVAVEVDEDGRRYDLAVRPPRRVWPALRAAVVIGALAAIVISRARRPRKGRHA